MTQPIRLLIAALITLLSSCDRQSEAKLMSHEEAIEAYQEGQSQFKSLISTVRDSESFDRALPELENIVHDWRELSEDLEKLPRPAQAKQVEYRRLIAQGNSETEPTGEDMLSLITIEDREAKVEAWLQTFVEAGQSVGTQFNRLYGSVHEEDNFEAELKNVKISIPENEASTKPNR